MEEFKIIQRQESYELDDWNISPEKCPEELIVADILLQNNAENVSIELIESLQEKEMEVINIEIPNAKDDENNPMDNLTITETQIVPDPCPEVNLILGDNPVENESIGIVETEIMTDNSESQNFETIKITKEPTNIQSDLQVTDKSTPGKNTERQDTLGMQYEITNKSGDNKKRTENKTKEMIYDEQYEDTSEEEEEDSVVQQLKVDKMMPCLLWFRRPRHTDISEIYDALAELIGAKNLVACHPTRDARLELQVKDVKSAAILIDQGLSLGEDWFQIFRIGEKAVKLILVNVPPFISDKAVIKALEPYGEPNGQEIKTAKVVTNKTQFLHLNTFKRELWIKKSGNKKIPEYLKVPFGKRSYFIETIVAETKCKRCGNEGHTPEYCIAELDKGEEYSNILTNVDYRSGKNQSKKENNANSNVTQSKKTYKTPGRNGLIPSDAEAKEEQNSWTQVIRKTRMLKNEILFQKESSEEEDSNNNKNLMGKKKKRILNVTQKTDGQDIIPEDLIINDKNWPNLPNNNNTIMRRIDKLRESKEESSQKEKIIIMGKKRPAPENISSPEKANHKRKTLTPNRNRFKKNDDQKNVEKLIKEDLEMEVFHIQNQEEQTVTQAEKKQSKKKIIYNEENIERLIRELTEKNNISSIDNGSPSSGVIEYTLQFLVEKQEEAGLITNLENKNTRRKLRVLLNNVTNDKQILSIERELQKENINNDEEGYKDCQSSDKSLHDKLYLMSELKIMIFNLCENIYTRQQLDNENLVGLDTNRASYLKLNKINGSTIVISSDSE